MRFVLQGGERYARAADDAGPGADLANLLNEAAILAARGDRKATLVMALSFSLGLSVELVPEILSQLPETVRNIFSSGITTGGVTAILANALIRIKE